MRNPLFFGLWVLFVIPAYFVATPETTRDFQSVAKQFRVAAMRDGKPAGLVLEGLRRPDPKLSFLLPAKVTEITGMGDVHKATVLESGPDWQLIEYEYDNTSSTVSRYRAYKDRVEPIYHRLTFHPGLILNAVLLMIPAWLLAALGAWVLRRAYPPKEMPPARPPSPLQFQPPQEKPQGVTWHDRLSFYARWLAIITMVFVPLLAIVYSALTS